MTDGEWKDLLRPLVRDLLTRGVPPARIKLVCAEVVRKTAGAGRPDTAALLRTFSAAPSASDAVEWVAPARLVVAPGRFQFRRRGAAPYDGTTRGLPAATFDPKRCAPLLCWRDPADGYEYVVDGHDRLAWAERDRARSVPARFIQAATAGEAKAIGARANLAATFSAPGPPPHPGWEWHEETNRWRNPANWNDTKAHEPAAPTAPAATRPPAPAKAPPTTAELEGARLGPTLHADVQVKHTASGDWVVKGRNGRRAAVENEALASGLARAVGLNVPQVHAVKLYGQDHAAVELVPGKSLAAHTPEQRREALARVPREDVERHALFDYLIGAGDSNNGNWLIGAKGELIGLDKEQSLRYGTHPIGDKAEYRIPFFLEDAGAPGRPAGDYQFSPESLSHMAKAGDTMAAKLKEQGRAKDAVGVERRTAVLKQLAAGGKPATAADIDRAGKAYDKSSPRSGGVLARLKGWFKR